MISETEFARRYTSSWRILTPMTEDFVRHVNGSWCVQMFAPLRNKDVLPRRRSVVNEIAFRALVIENHQSKVMADAELLLLAAAELACDPRWVGKVDQLDEYEEEEAWLLLFRLRQFVSANRSEGLILFPTFPGCGLLDGCIGDLILGQTLYEVKAGDRFFRSIDLRQLLIYAMLNWRARTYEFEKLGIFNPRVGIYYEGELSDICYEVSGKSATELFADMSDVISGSGFSR